MNDGLVDESDRTIRERVLQSRLDPEPAHDRGVHGGLVEHVAVPAAPLRLVHGQIGIAQDRLGRLPRSGHGNPDTGPDGLAPAAELHRRFAQGRKHPVGQSSHLHRSHAFHQQGELVTTKARRNVSGSAAPFQTMRNGNDDFVAAGMAEAVVDRLEVVQVDEQDRHPGGPAPREGMADTVVKELAVG